MAKFFNKNYEGLPESEAWQRIYEYGKNLMPIKERNVQKIYNKIFAKKTKTIRDGILKKINTDRLVPGDIIILAKGQIIPVDGVVLEEDTFETNQDILPIEEEFKNKEASRVVYQGIKVISGTAVIKAVRTGDATYLGSIIKKIDRKNKLKILFGRRLHINTNIIGIFGLIMLIFGTIFSFATGSGDFVTRLSEAGYSGLLLFIASVPIGAAILVILKILKQINITKKSNLSINRWDTLLRAEKTSVICIDDRFLTRNYEKYVQRLYRAGIRIAVISEESEQKLRELVKDAGICEENILAISGKEIENMSEENLKQVICDAIIFFDMNKSSKNKVIESFEKLGIKTISIGDNISDLVSIENSNIGICTHGEKKSLEYNFSVGKISGFNFTSIYSLIKGSLLVKNYINQYIKLSLIFHLPIILSLLVALLSGIKLDVFYFQTLMSILVLIPLLLVLSNRDYSDDELFKLKERTETFTIDCIKCATIGAIIGILGIGIFKLLELMGFTELFNINTVLVVFVALYGVIVFFSIKTDSANKEKVKIPREEKIVEKQVKEEVIVKNELVKKEVVEKKEAIKKEKVIKPKKVKESKQKKMEEMKDNIL